MGNVSQKGGDAQEIVRNYLKKSKAEFEQKWQGPQPPCTNCQQFRSLRIIGRGAFGRVMLVEQTETGDMYAMKILRKDTMIKLKQVERTLTEKKILYSINFPFVISLKYHCKDSTCCYLVMDFVSGGDLFTRLKNCRKLCENECRFYCAQIVLACQYLHSQNIVHRDLKPENILIDVQGNIKVTDLGSAKRVIGRTYTLCGTPEYFAPEVIMAKGYSRAVDWWALGIILFEMAAGFTPFYAEEPMKLYEKIVCGKVCYPSHFSKELKNILKNLIQVDLTKRFGNLKNGIEDIKSHKWFGKLESDWISVYHKKLEPPFIPPFGQTPGDSFNDEGCEEDLLQLKNMDEYSSVFAEF